MKGCDAEEVRDFGQTMVEKKIAVLLLESVVSYNVI